MAFEEAWSRLHMSKWWLVHAVSGQDTRTNIQSLALDASAVLDLSPPINLT